MIMDLDAIGSVSPDILATFERAHAVAAETIGAELFALVRARVDFLLGRAEPTYASRSTPGRRAALRRPVRQLRAGRDRGDVDPAARAAGTPRACGHSPTPSTSSIRAARLSVTHSRLFTPGELTPGPRGQDDRGPVTRTAEPRVPPRDDAPDGHGPGDDRNRPAARRELSPLPAVRVGPGGRRRRAAGRRRAGRAHRRLRDRPLAPEPQAALRYADVHMIDPRRLDAELRDELRALFTPRSWSN